MSGLVALTCCALAIAFCLAAFWYRSSGGIHIPSYDIYAAHQPIALYAREALERGHGLLWNPLQNCGQPFLPSTLAGALYPPNWLLLLDPHHGFLVLAIFHMAITGIGMYALCREMLLGRVASLSAALGWEFSTHVVSLAGWQPTSILGVYVWIPYAMLCVERILKRPTLPNGIALACVLTLQLLPGYPQILLFTLELLGLRMLWQILFARGALAPQVLASLALGLILPLLLGAAALLPMLDFADVSLRNTSLSSSEIDPSAGGPLTWEIFRSEVGGLRFGMFGPMLSLVPIALAGLGVASGKHRGPWLFYLLASLVFVTLAFENPLSKAYGALPLAQTFRYPSRFLWLAGFTLSVLCGFGVNALARVEGPRGRGLAIAVLGVATGATLFYLVSPTGLRSWEWYALIGLIGACLLAFLAPRAAPAPWIATLLLVASAWLVNGHPLVSLIRDEDALLRHREAFEYVRARMTPQDRIHQYGMHPDYSMMPKSASIFGVRSVDDYEPQASRRYAEYYVRMMDARPMQNINQYYFRMNNEPRNWPLLDLSAVRYVLVAPPMPVDGRIFTRKLSWLASVNGVSIFENPGALPRAFYVPTAVVLAGPDDILHQLSSVRWNARKALLLEEVPADGFLGGKDGTGSVEILSDHSEELELAVTASAEGFLFLSDQAYPGWQATVNGEPRPILRANHAFRALRVPAGTSRVVFRYRPTSVRVGFAISLAAWVGVLVALGIHRCRGRSRTAVLDHAARSRIPHGR